MALSVHTIERFDRFEYAAGGPVTDPIRVGMLFDLSVPPETRRRFIWIAAGAFLQVNPADHWFVQGKLNFYLRGKKTGELSFSDASAWLSAAERAIAQRPVIRIRADGSGSVQPILRYQDGKSAGNERDNLDIACVGLLADADRIEFEIERSYYVTANPLYILCGIRVLSTN